MVAQPVSAPQAAPASGRHDSTATGRDTVRNGGAGAARDIAPEAYGWPRDLDCRARGRTDNQIAVPAVVAS